MGLTVLVDARRCSPVPALFKVFSTLQVSFEPGQRSTGCLAGMVGCYISICCLCLHLPSGLQLALGGGDTHPALLLEDDLDLPDCRQSKTPWPVLVRGEHPSPPLQICFHLSAENSPYPSLSAVMNYLAWRSGPLH